MVDERKCSKNFKDINCQNGEKQGFPGSSVVKNAPANAGSIPRPGRSHIPRSN